MKLLVTGDTSSLNLKVVLKVKYHTDSFSTTQIIFQKTGDEQKTESRRSKVEEKFIIYLYNRNNNYQIRQSYQPFTFP